MKAKESIVIRQEELPAVRKRQPPPGKAMDGKERYTRKRKHPKREGIEGENETPGGESLRALLHSGGRVAGFRPRGAAR